MPPVILQQKTDITFYGDATKNIEQIFPLNIDVFSLDEDQLCEVVNFVRGSRESKYFTITMEELKGYTSEERKQITAKYSEVCEKLEIQPSDFIIHIPNTSKELKK